MLQCGLPCLFKDFNGTDYAFSVINMQSLGSCGINGAKHFVDIIAALCFSDRAKLYERIERRVDLMIENGLIDEVKAVAEKGYDRSLPALQGLGYKQLLMYPFEKSPPCADAVCPVCSKISMARIMRFLSLTCNFGNVPPKKYAKSPLEEKTRLLSEEQAFTSML